MSVLNYSRTFMSAVSGAAAGILGLTGLYGFVFYFITAFCLSIMLVLKAGRHWNQYFTTCRPIFTNGLLGGLFTYILFWTDFYMAWFMFIEGGLASCMYRLKKTSAPWVEGPVMVMDQSIP